MPVRVMRRGGGGGGGRREQQCGSGRLETPHPGSLQ